MSEKETPETILEKENCSEATMNQPQTSTESAGPSASGCESSTKTESEKQLRLFVSLLTVRVLTKCNALKNRSQEEWVAHTKVLIDKTMEGLAITEGFCPDVKSTKKICKAVVKDLQKKFGGRRLLESMLILQDPDVDAAIVQSLQTHVKDFPARLAKNDAPLISWQEVLKILAVIGTFVLLIVLSALFP